MKNYRQIWEAIAEEIKEDIINGRYGPDERLKEAELAEKYDVSKTPVREALRYLEGIGFVEIVPHTMARVKKMNKKEVEEFYVIQSVLEGLAAREAVPNLKEGDFEKMEKYVALLEKYSREKNSVEYEKANINFHSIFWKASNNEKLREMIRNIHEQVLRFRTVTRKYPERFKVLAADHRRIMESARKKDAEKVEKLFRQHVEKQTKYIVEILEREEHI
ncbi:MAG: GntR family transcriptional regulator [Deltaproteobacteria bacterium]|nr:GntR family transcriptional regulator [Deltaproteobacteria bacterium]MBW2136685.1 GntR family transcriptional regulator [Deltaproteobacteria bacterium]